jgi:tetratricopeptide (TPR) repeat protein
VTSPARYRTDPETLHEVILNPEELSRWLDARLLAAVPAEPDAERRHRTDIGVAARALRRLDVAESQLAAALELALRHGSPAHAVLARVRYAHVLQWQGRFDEATAEFQRCLASAADAGDRAHFVHQHAGKCAYDLGDWTIAVTHFREALRLREALQLQLAQQPREALRPRGTLQPREALRPQEALGDPELIESTRLALDAADACATASAAAAELHRLVPGGHNALRPEAAPLVAPAQPNVGVLIDIRNLLLAGPAPLPAVRAIHRYHPGLDDALGDLATRGWLTLGPETVSPTDRCRTLLTSLMELMDRVFTRLWGQPAALLSTLDDLVAAGRGTSEGDAFDALADAGHPSDGTMAGRLFSALCAMRYHRADAHAAAWSSEGLTAAQARSLDPNSPQRLRIEATTDRIASRPYRTLTPDRRAHLRNALTTLDDETETMQ